MATQVIGQYARKAYQDFSSGQNSYFNPLRIKESEFVSLQNAIVNQRGILEYAPGYVKDGSPFPNVSSNWNRMLVNFRRGTTVNSLVCASLDTANTNATYKVDLKQTFGDGNYAYIGHTTGTAEFTNGNTGVTGHGTSWLSHLKAGDKIKATAQADGVYAEIQTVNSDTSLTLTANYTGATATGGGAGVAYIARIILSKNLIPASVNFNDVLVVTNGAEKPEYFDNTTILLITNANAPKGKFIENHKNRVFMANTTADPSGLYWSHTYDQTSWEGNSVERIFPADGGQICAIRSFADSLIVLKDNGKMYQVVGNFDQDTAGSPTGIRRLDVPDNLGRIAGYTAVIHDDGRLHFLAQTGWYAMDTALRFQKLSWPIQDIVSGATISSGAATALTFTYDTKTQFDNGTHSGTRATTGGILENVFDTFKLTDALQVHGGVSVYIDSSNNVHVCYINQSNGPIPTYSIKYKKYLYTDNSLAIDETPVTLTPAGGTSYPIQSLSIDMSPAGTIGIAYKTNSFDGALYGVPSYYFTERLGGSWITPQLFETTTVPLTDDYGISMRYRSDNDPRVAVGVSHGGHGLQYFGRSGSTWTTHSDQSAIGRVFHCSLYLNSDTDPKCSVTQNGAIKFVTTSIGDQLEVNTDNFAITTATPNNGCMLDKNSSNHFVEFYIDGGILNKRDLNTTTSSTVDASTSCFFNGAKFDSSDKVTAYYSISNQEKLTVEDSTTILNSTSNTANKITPGDRGMHSHGDIFVTACFGQNANELIIRRFKYRGTWTSASNSDGSLSSWGVYSVSGETDAGNSVTHQIDAEISGSYSSYTNITNGQLISTDTTRNFLSIKVLFVLQDFTQSTIDSIVANYIGAGVGPAQATSFVFNNEIYTGITPLGGSSNSEILFYDKGGAFGVRGYPITFMARLDQVLYGGSSTNGDIYKLNIGTTFNGSSYTLTATSKEDLLGSIELVKDVYKIYVIYETQNSGTFNLNYSLDNFINGASFTQTTIDQTVNGIAEIPIGQTCRSLQVQITATNPIGIIGWIILYGFLTDR